MYNLHFSANCCHFYSHQFLTFIHYIFLSLYIGPETQSDSEIRMGKYGVLMSLYQECQARLTEPSGEDNHVLSLDDISHLLGQHIVGTNPKVIGNLENDKPSEKEEEDKLLFQEFLLDPSISVGDLLKENGVTIDSFVRFACGEDLPQDEAN